MRAVAHHRVNGDRLNSSPRRPESLQSINTKFETGDFVRTQMGQNKHVSANLNGVLKMKQQFY